MVLQPSTRPWTSQQVDEVTTSRGSAPQNVSEAWIRISRPLLPTIDRIAPYLRQIDAARFYTNGGALQERLLEALASHYGVDTDRIGLAGSGTAAIVGLLLGAGSRAGTARPLCVCPAYTFVATACAAEMCGYVPYLADVNPKTWALDPSAVEALPQFAQIGAVIVVASYGLPVDLASWGEFAQRTGRIVVVDAAASFDTISPAAVMASGLPVAISLHATKTLSTAEGGLMLCSDTRLVRRAVAAINFGFDGARTSIVPGTNGKLSEYHAAIGLADLEAWAHKRSAFMTTAKIYSTFADTAGIGDMIIVNTRQALPYALFLARDKDEAVRVSAGLTAHCIEARRWYGDGVQAHPAYIRCMREPLPTTDDLALRLIGLPFAVDLASRDIDRVVDALAQILGGTDGAAGDELCDRRPE